MYRFGLLGHNIGYTRSPEIFREIYRRLEAEGTYDVFDISSDRLTVQWDGLLSKELQGLSVTIPHKAAVVGLLTEVDAVAAKIGVVNCVKVRDAHTTGLNTDGYGLTVALNRVAADFRTKSALVIGNGGVAKAVVYSLAMEFEVKHVTVMGRDAARLAAFCRSMGKVLPDVRIDMVRNGGLDRVRVDLIVNCTPLGGPNYPDQSPLVGSAGWLGATMYCDVNYNQGNQIVTRARADGLQTIDGSTMLVAQALRTFELCTGVTGPPLEVIYGVVFGKTRQLP